MVAAAAEVAAAAQVAEAAEASDRVEAIYLGPSELWRVQLRLGVQPRSPSSQTAAQHASRISIALLQDRR